MLHLEFLPLDTVVLQVFDLVAFREVDKESTLIDSHLYRSTSVFDEYRAPEFEAIEFLASGQSRHTTQHSVIHTFTSESPYMIGYPYPINIRK